MATGSIAGSILQAVCLVIGVLIYLPFLRLFEERDERRLVKNVKELTKVCGDKGAERQAAGAWM